jgi:hypothetical protein
MKTGKYFALGSILLFAFACELDDTTLSVAERLEGHWKVDENTPVFKSANDFYFVDIQIYAIDSNKIRIDRFFDIDNGSVIAEINGMTLTLNQQEAGDGYMVYGSGTIDGSYNKITWRYYVDEGSGTWHETDAVFTKVED